MSKLIQFRVRRFVNGPNTANALLVLLLFFLFTAGTSHGQEMVFPGAEWETGTPESQGVNSLRLGAAVAYIHPDFGSSDRELVVVRNGRIIWESAGSQTPQQVTSVTKSFTSTVLGLLVDDGAASLQTHAADYVPSLAESYSDVTLRHFTTMTSGYQSVGEFGTSEYWEPAEPRFAPGEMFHYSNSGMDQLANALTQIAGEPIADLFARRIADPIGMSGWSWPEQPISPPGTAAPVNIGNTGMAISARDAARFGHLFLNGGQWNGEQLISTEWVNEATCVQVPPEIPPDPQTLFGVGPGIYGYNWFVDPVSFVAKGINDSTIDVLPEWNMVLAKTSPTDIINPIAWAGAVMQIGSGLLPENGTQVDLAPAAVYEVIDDTFDDAGDRTVDVSAEATAEIGEVDAADANHVSKLIVKFALPDPPEGRPVLQRAILGIRPVSTEGPPADPISVWHSSSDNALAPAASDYEDPGYVDTLGDIVPPIDAVTNPFGLGLYYDLDVTALVLGDYAADGSNPLSAFRLQMDGASFVEDDQSHCYTLSMPGATYRPQLILTFVVPEPSALLLGGIFCGVAVFLRRRVPTRDRVVRNADSEIVRRGPVTIERPCRCGQGRYLF